MWEMLCVVAGIFTRNLSPCLPHWLAPAHLSRAIFTADTHGGTRRQLQGRLCTILSRISHAKEGACEWGCCNPLSHPNSQLISVEINSKDDFALVSFLVSPWMTLSSTDCLHCCLGMGYGLFSCSPIPQLYFPVTLPVCYERKEPERETHGVQ